MSTITITGPGGAICAELSIIKKALLDCGFEVKVTDKDCPEQQDEKRDWEYIEHIKKLNAERKLVGITPSEVHIVMEHRPWGG